MRNTGNSAKRSRRRLRCEALEPRRVLATVVLSSDTGVAGELRTELANASPGDTIDFNLPAGSETISLSAGELVIDKDITINGSNVSGSGTPITIDAGGSSRVLNVSDGDPMTTHNVSLSHLTITGGSTAAIVPVEDGGGIRNFENLSISDSTITGNFSADDGGGIFSNGTLNLVRTAIDNNEAEDRAAGLFAYGTISITDNSSISGNVIDTTTGDAIGVGALFGAGSSTTIDDTTVRNNVGNTTYVDPATGTEANGRGAGLYVSGFSGAVPTDITITNSLVEGNNTDGMGGGIQSGIAVNMLIDNTTFRSNVAAGDAGAIGSSSFGVDANTKTVVRNSLLTLNSSTTDDGGAIEADGGVHFSVIDSVISSNTAANDGGGIYARGRDAVLDTVLVITGTTMNNNSAVDDGGAIQAGSNVILTIDDSTFDKNHCDSRGGALSLTFADDPNEQSSAIITDSTFVDNSTLDDGGALYIAQQFAATIENTTITGNSSFDGGAGIRIQSLTTAVTIKDSTISDNDSMGFGGGIHNIGGANVVIDRSTISGNSAVGGGGGMDTTGSAISLINSTVSGNTTEGVGGGLYLNLDPADPVTYSQMLTGTTVTNNQADTYGGGVYTAYYAQVAFDSTIIAGNTSPTSPDLFNESGTITRTYTLLGDNSGTMIGETSLDANGNIVGGTVGGIVDPMLGALADNGGPTMTHMPLASSPVLEAGNPSTAAATDQRGATRVWDSTTNVAGGIADMGAVERGAPISNPIDVDFNDDGLANCLDIDALHAEVLQGTNAPQYDLNGDGAVDRADHALWLADAAIFNGFSSPYQQADFNLSRSVDVSDFGIFNAHKFTAQSAFCSGDANVDGSVDVSDFGIFNSMKFTTPAAARPDNASQPSLTGEELRARRQSSIADEFEESEEVASFDSMAADNGEVARAAVDLQPLTLNSQEPQRLLPTVEWVALSPAVSTTDRFVLSSGSYEREKTTAHRTTHAVDQIFAELSELDLDI